MAKRRYTAEEIVRVLRQVEVSIANGRATPQACRESGIAEQTYYRWRLAVSQQEKWLSALSARLRKMRGEGLPWC
jgi:Transposase